MSETSWRIQIGPNIDISTTFMQAAQLAADFRSSPRIYAWRLSHIEAGPRKQLLLNNISG